MLDWLMDRKLVDALLRWLERYGLNLIPDNKLGWR